MLGRPRLSATGTETGHPAMGSRARRRSDRSIVSPPGVPAGPLVKPNARRCRDDAAPVAAPTPRVVESSHLPPCRLHGGKSGRADASGDPPPSEPGMVPCSDVGAQPDLRVEGVTAGRTRLGRQVDGAHAPPRHSPNSRIALRMCGGMTRSGSATEIGDGAGTTSTHSASTTSSPPYASSACRL